MGFGEWFLQRGRISRRTWWLHYCLPLVGLYLLAGVADAVLGYPGLTRATQDVERSFATTGGPLEVGISALFAVPWVSSAVARLHDRGLTARWLWWWFVPGVGALITLVQSGFLAGDAGPNLYGPPPGVPREPVAA